jgi:BMFP domain-containing protein YqiC
MSELKSCPFCGWEFAEHAWNEFGEEYRVCDQCGATSGTVNSMWDWNTRPIEDALNARIAELEATVEIHADISNAYEKRISEIVSLSNKANAKLQSRIAELEAALEHVIEVGNYGWDVIRKYGWEEKEINWWNTASDKAYKCLRKGRRER